MALTRLHAVVCAALAVAPIPSRVSPAAAQELRVLCSNGLRGAMQQLRAEAERAIGRPIAITFGASAVLRRSIEAGEPFDVAVLTPQVIGALEQAGAVGKNTAAEIARVNLAVGVRAGSPRADIGSADAIKRRLLAAKSVTYAREGASNPAILKMLDRLGIAEEIQKRTVLQVVSGRPAESVAEGVNELVLAPLSEIVMVKGVEVLGLFPPEFQDQIVMTAAVAAKSEHAAAARQLIAFLQGAQVAGAMKSSGVEPSLRKD